MKIRLLNTARGLMPCYDDDFDEKKKLKIGAEYMAEIKLVRNPMFHRKFFALINCAWEYLPERQTKGFRSKENFRNYLTVAAGFNDVFFSPKLREWVEIPKSIAFDKMDEAEFSELYERVKDVLFEVFLKNISIEEFEANLINF